MIDYRKISDAVDFYRKLGYKYIEVPWIVSESTSSITTPKGRKNFKTFMGNLVASGEQSFLEIRSHLLGRYVCVTPCFRDENEVNDLCRNYFMKVELIDVKPKFPDLSSKMIMMDAFKFFQRYGKVSIEITDEGMDLKMNEIEIGSYGFRSKKANYKGKDFLIGIDWSDPYTKDEFVWAYGTGCAEPRLSMCC